MPPAATLSTLPSPVRDQAARRRDVGETLGRSDRAHRAKAFHRPARDLRREVADCLARSGYAALSLVGCEVERNNVILRGDVPSYHLKQIAQVCAQRVEGVERIDNRLQVLGRSAL